MRPKVLLIGLDGATPQVLFPLVEKGELPHLAGLMAQGTWGGLRSTYPPLTPTAWTSFFTGVGPGSHGLFDFIELIPGEYRLRFTNANSRRQTSMWKILNDRGVKVGLYNLPMSYPPEALDAFAISGLDTPDEKSAFAYPAAVKEEILRHFGALPLDPRHLGFMRTDPLRAKVLQEINEIEARRAEIFLYLLARHPVDVAMAVFTATDTVQHFFWHYFDPDHHRHLGQNHPFGGAVAEVYRAVDKVVGRVCAAVGAPEHVPVLIMSDHGHQPTSRQVFHPNRLLRNLGLLRLSGSSSRYLSRLDDLLKILLPPRFKGKMAALFPQLRTWWESQAASLGDFDWRHTKAFCLEVLSIPLGYWIHTREHFPMGIVGDALEYEGIVRQIIAELHNLGLKGIHKSELYQGPYLHLAPDILIDWWSEGLVIKRSFPAPEFAPVLTEVQADESAAWSGIHQMEGIFILSGPPFQAGHYQDEATLLDLAPTLFQVLGQETPIHFEGQALHKAFKSSFEVTAAPQGKPTPCLPGDKKETYTAEEAESIQKKLKDLGYL